MASTDGSLADVSLSSLGRISEDGNDDTSNFGQARNSEDERLCWRCRLLDFDYVGYHASPDYGSNSYFITREFSGIVTSAETCEFCARVVSIVDEWKLRLSKNTIESQCDFDRASVDIRLETDWHDVKTDVGTLKNHAHSDRVRVNIAIPSFCTGQRSHQITVFLQRAPPTDTAESADDARFLGRSRPLIADRGVLKRWKETCDLVHGAKCRTIFKTDERVKPRLIDVQQRCLVDAAGDDEWVCLSYVWGKTITLQSTRNNVQSLYERGSLTPQVLPNVIEDAILVTLAAGERFLWVDALCIVQDDENDKARFIAKMDAIYILASIVIVAATCIDSDSCLPGVRDHSRSQIPQPFSVKGVRLIQSLDPADGLEIDLQNGRSTGYLGKTVWNTRAWTLQERFLASRCLVFTPEQVFWECESGFWCEDSVREIPEILPDPRRTSLCGGELTAAWNTAELTFDQYYRTLLGEYSRRVMSRETDGLNAFLGVVRAFETSTKEPFWWGTPTAFLESALAWGYPSATLRRRQGVFPSWSWCGWIDDGNAKIQNQDLLMEPLGLQFYKLDEFGEGLIPLKQKMVCNQKHDLLAEGSGVDPREKRVAEIQAREALQISPRQPHLNLYFWTAVTTLETRQASFQNDTREPNPQGSRTWPTTLWQGKTTINVSWAQTPRFQLSPTIEVAAISQNRGVWDGRHIDNGAIGVMVISWTGAVAVRQGFAWMAIRDWTGLRERRWRMIVLA